MTWELSSDRPIYSQIIDKIKTDIISGKYPAGSKIPSVRELATEASVNPNTMQKALAELEKEGLLFSQRTSGRYITEDQNMINEIRTQLAIDIIASFFKKMNSIGYSNEEALALIQKAAGGIKDE